MFTVRALRPEEVGVVGDSLGLARWRPGNEGNGFYLVAWEGDVPAGHLHLALTDPPELQDVQVASTHRQRGVARTLIAAAEAEAWARGFRRMCVTTGVGNEAAQALYRSCGYEDADVPPKHVKGTIQTRTGPIEVDEVLITLEKLHPHVRATPQDLPATKTNSGV